MNENIKMAMQLLIAAAFFYILTLPDIFLFVMGIVKIIFWVISVICILAIFGILSTSINNFSNSNRSIDFTKHQASTYWIFFFGTKKRTIGNLSFLMIGFFILTMVIIGAFKEGLTNGTILALTINILFLAGIFLLNYLNYKKQ